MKFGKMHSFGEIVLASVQFTDTFEIKKRPVLVIKSANDLNDFVCLQITSKHSSGNLLKIENTDIENGVLKLISFVRYDKCFTLNTQIIDKKLAKVDMKYINKIKTLFCTKIF